MTRRVNGRSRTRATLPVTEHLTAPRRFALNANSRVRHRRAQRREVKCSELGNLLFLRGHHGGQNAGTASPRGVRDAVTRGSALAGSARHAAVVTRLSLLCESELSQ